MKGVEGLPLKYITMLLVAAILIVSLLYITGLFQATAIEGTQQANQTVNEILNSSLGGILGGSSSP